MHNYVASTENRASVMDCQRPRYCSQLMDRSTLLTRMPLESVSGTRCRFNGVTHSFSEADQKAALNQIIDNARALA
jgi:hypothetical protein